MEKHVEREKEKRNLGGEIRGWDFKTVLPSKFTPIRDSIHGVNQGSKNGFISPSTMTCNHSLRYIHSVTFT